MQPGLTSWPRHRMTQLGTRRSRRCVRQHGSGYSRDDPMQRLQRRDRTSDLTGQHGATGRFRESEPVVSSDSPPSYSPEFNPETASTVPSLGLFSCCQIYASHQPSGDTILSAATKRRSADRRETRTRSRSSRRTRRRRAREGPPSRRPPRRVTRSVSSAPGLLANSTPDRGSSSFGSSAASIPWNVPNTTGTGIRAGTPSIRSPWPASAPASPGS